MLAEEALVGLIGCVRCEMGVRREHMVRVDVWTTHGRRMDTLTHRRIDASTHLHFATCLKIAQHHTT